MAQEQAIADTLERKRQERIAAANIVLINQRIAHLYLRLDALESIGIGSLEAINIKEKLNELINLRDNII